MIRPDKVAGAIKFLDTTGTVSRRNGALLADYRSRVGRLWGLAGFSGAHPLEQLGPMQARAIANQTSRRTWFLP